jgi:hypothetical protein
MPARLLVLAALLLAAPRPGAAQETPRARNSPCTGVYTGSARGVFWCRVIAQHDAKTNRTVFRVDTEGDIQLNGDALSVLPGQLEWNGAPAVGVLRQADARVVSAAAALQTSQPPHQVTYAAARAAPKVAADQGQITLDLVSVEPGPAAAGIQPFKVHGTFSAVLPPVLGGEFQGIGEVRISVTF